MTRLITLKAQAEVIKAEIAHKQAQLSDLHEQIGEIEWVPIEWNDLKVLLKSEYSNKDYRDCPRVAQKNGSNYTYCFITEGGDLQIGPYFYNDKFPPGKALYIHRSKKTWSQ